MSALPEGPVILASRTVCEHVTLEAVQGDITSLRVDAITNAANDRLWMGSGVAGAIKRKGGDAIEREAMSKGPIAVGTAVETGAGSLPSRHVIHAAVMGQDLTTDIGIVRRCTRSVVELALRLGAGSLAMPLLGTGVGGLNARDVADAMVEEVAALVRESSCPPFRVLLVGLDPRAAVAVRSAVEGLPSR